MQIAYSYPPGQTVVAAVLAVGADFVRVAASKRIDGIDGFDLLYLRDQGWFTDTGRVIRVDAIVLGE